MTYAQNTATAGNTAGLPSLTVGPKAGSGANFDPGTNPTAGDTAGTDCAAALQAALNAAVASPYSTTHPAVVQLLPGTFNCWNTGTTSIPILAKSAGQRIVGAGMRSTTLKVNSANGQAAITVGASPYTYTNSSGNAQIVTVNTNGCTWSTATPVQHGATALNVPSGAGSTNTAWNTFAGSLTFCVENGGTVVLTYSAGAPTMSASLSFLMWNVAPTAIGSGVELLEVTVGANGWARGIDPSSDPNNGLGYSETTRPFRLISVFTDPDAGWTDNSVNLDGLEGATFIDNDIQGGLSFRCVKGQVNIFNSFITKCHLAGQTVNIYGAAFADNSTSTGVTGITIDGINSTNDVIGFPTTVNYYGVTHNGSATGGACVNDVVNNNAKTTVIHNLFGGWFGEPAGTAAAYFVTNEATTILNIYGNPTFRKTTSGTPNLFGSLPAFISVQGGVSIGGTATLAALFTNSQLAAAAALTGAGLSSPFIVGAAVQVNETGAATVLTVTPPSVAGTYRLIISIDCISSTAGIGGWTATWDDSGGNEQAPANLELYDAAVLLGAFTFTYTAGHHYRGECEIDIDNSGDNIVISTTKTSGTFSITVTAIVERLA